jgi:ACS family hexuronate transporter-like MFS transporter
MSNFKDSNAKMTNYRWAICAMLFFATMVNYMDRQVLSLTWKDFIAPEFHWTNNDYGTITALFSIFYAICMLFAGRFVDWMDTKKGFLWAIGVWSVGAVLHAFCGIATAGFVTGNWVWSFTQVRDIIANLSPEQMETGFYINKLLFMRNVGFVMNLSVLLFIFARFVLALGEAGNFPAAIKATAEYFPKKDRAYATSIFNAGSTIGALAAPLTIPVIAKHYGWEMSFIIIGLLGFVWMGFWQFIYKKPEKHPKVNKAELAYILSDSEETQKRSDVKEKVSFLQCFKYRQTWAFAFGKFMTDGVWWFYLFWMPAYLSDVYGIKSSDSLGQWAIFVVYLIVMLSLYGGKLPTIIINRTGKNPYSARMQAMLIFAFFPLLALLAQPLGHITFWIPVVIVGIAGAAHQSWSANIFSTIGDMFPKKAIATITGIGGMAGGVGSFLINKGSGWLFDFSANTNMQLLGFEGIKAGYFIIFCICAVAYLIGWTVMKALVPEYKPITDL